MDQKGKIIKKFAKIGLIIFLVLISVPVLSLLFLQNRQVQTLVSKRVAEKLSGELQTNISLSSVSYSFFKRVQVRDLYIEDLQGDTLLYSELTRVRFRYLRPERRQIEIARMVFENYYLNLVIDSTGGVNLTFITDRLRKPHVPPEKKNLLRIGTIEMTDGRFSLTRPSRPAEGKGVEFNDFHLRDLDISISELTSYMDTVTIDIRSLSAAESSGFRIDQLETLLTLGRKHMHFGDLRFKSAESDLNLPLLTFEFESWREFRHFSREVELQGHFNQSLVKMRELGYFAKGTEDILDHVVLDGRVSGPLSDFRGDDLFVTFDDNSTLAFDFMMIGLPDFRNTFLDFDFREMKTSVPALTGILHQVQDTVRPTPYPWRNLGGIDFQGQFTGYPDHFVAAGYLATDLGKMILDLSFRPDTLGGLDFNGRLRTGDFRLGEFLEQEDAVARLDMDVMTEGTLDQGRIQASMNGHIDTLEIFRYAYSNIALDGTFTNETFNGGFRVSDPNIQLEFEGMMDFSGSVPEYRFRADVSRARPYYLKLISEDPETFVSFLVETDLSGSHIDELNGEIRLVNSLFVRNDAQVQVYNLNISARNTPDSSRFTVNSDLLDANVEGTYRLSTLPRSFKNLADQYMDVIPGPSPLNDTINRFTYEVHLKQLNQALEVFLPGLEVGRNSFISGSFRSGSNQMELQGDFPYLRAGMFRWNQLDVRSGSDPDHFSLQIRSDSMTFRNAYTMPGQGIDLTATNDTSRLTLTWEHPLGPGSRGQLDLNGSLTHDSLGRMGLVLNVEPADLYISGQQWEVEPFDCLIRKEYLRINDLAVRSRLKHIIADGVISSSVGQSFQLEVKNLDLAQLSGLIDLHADLEGEITGQVRYRFTGGEPQILSDLNIDTLRFNQQYLGPTRFNAGWNPASQSIMMKLQSSSPEGRIVDVEGSYTPDNQAVDFDIHLDQFRLRSLAPYLEGITEDPEGHLQVDLTLDGSIQQPELNGTIEFSEAAVTVSYLNTRYLLNDRVRVYNNNLYLEDFLITDPYGHTARINGSLSNRYFNDLYLNLRMEANNLMWMNTTARNNEDFYGTVFATGDITISGSPGSVNLQITATTENNTSLSIPLYTAREVKSIDFINFTDREDPSDLPEILPQNRLKGLNMELEVEITPAAIVRLIFDPQVGDIIETGGRGNLRMDLSPQRGIQVFGDVELLRGEYLFTLQNVINKKFQIEPGGRINFNGSPTDASVDLEAIYTTRTSPYNLYPGDRTGQESLKKRIPVECRLNLQGELQSPTISPDIALPTADPETRDLLANSTSTEEELMRQFLSLLVINDFYSVTGFGGQDVGSVNTAIAGVTASELLSNQLTNWLSQISDDFDIGVNYRPGDEISSDELELALSTQLLNDRIILSGNVDLGGQETNPSTGVQGNPYVVGDFDVEFKVTDNISIIAFNRARDELIFETAPYKQGVGVSYQEDFNTFRQLINRIGDALTNRKKKKKGLPEEAEITE